MIRAWAIAKPRRAARFNLKALRLRTIISVLLMVAVPSSALAGMGWANCQHGSGPSTAAVHHDGAPANHSHTSSHVAASDAMGASAHGAHHQHHDGTQQQCSCSKLCAMAYALVFAPPTQAPSLQLMVLWDHPARAAQDKWSDAPSGEPFRPPIYLSV